MSHKVLVILAGAFLLLISIGEVAHAEKIGSPGDLFRSSKIETGVLELGREAVALPMTFSRQLYEEPAREQNEESWISREQNEESWISREQNEESWTPREKNEESGATDEQPVAVSEPMTIVLLAVGLFGVALLERRFRSHGIRRTS